MPSLMYLIFSKKQRITFFDPPGGRAGQIFFTLDDIIIFASHQAPFPGLEWRNWFLQRRLSLEDYFWFLSNLLVKVVGINSYFPPHIKCISLAVTRTDQHNTHSLQILLVENSGIKAQIHLIYVHALQTNKWYYFKEKKQNKNLHEI